MDRLVCVSFYMTEKRPSLKNLAKKFRTYGKVLNIIWDSHRKDHFFVKYELREAAIQCYEHRHVLYQKFGYIVELKDEIQTEAYNGKSDSNLPSILNLNDDCLMHLLGYLKDERAVKFVCVRFRQLLQLLWRKEHHVTCGIPYDKQCLDQLYHTGDYVTHLTIHLLPRNTHEVLFESCRNLKYLCLDNNYDSFNLQPLKNITPSVTEMEFKQFESGMDIVETLRDNNLKLKKLCIVGCVISYSKISTMSSLTTLLIVRTILDVGQVLRNFPQLVVLGCTLCRATGPIPESNSLQELFVRNYDEDDGIGELIKIREGCKELRHLRVDNIDLFEHGISRFLPLDGLHLTAPNVTLDKSKLTRLADEVIILFLANRFWKIDEYGLVLAKFTKLEVTSWCAQSFYDTSIDSFLTNRSAKVPLNIIGCKIRAPMEYQKEILPSCKWYWNSRDLFGPFSIYSAACDEEPEEDVDSEYDSGDSDFSDFDYY